MHERWPFYLLMLLSAGMTATSQMLLKTSANRPHASPVREYLNPRVILAYGLFGAVLLLNVYIYTVMDLRWGVAVNGMSSLMVMALSAAVLGEKLTGRRLLGNGLILLGVIVFSLF